MSILCLFVFCFILQFGDCGYPSFGELTKTMRSHVASFNNLRIPNISSKDLYVGKSMQNRSIEAYCFGNCESGSSSVFLLYLLDFSFLCLVEFTEEREAA